MLKVLLNLFLNFPICLLFDGILLLDLVWQQLILVSIKKALVSMKRDIEKTLF
jgi:hypothetical protein